MPGSLLSLIPVLATLLLAVPSSAALAELWHYCTHEVHHAGVMRLQPLAEAGVGECGLPVTGWVAPFP